LKESNTGYDEELKELKKNEMALKSKEIDLKEDVGKAREELQALSHKISSNTKRLKSLKITDNVLREEDENPTIPVCYAKLISLKVTCEPTYPAFPT